MKKFIASVMTIVFMIIILRTNTFAQTDQSKVYNIKSNDLATIQNILDSSKKNINVSKSEDVITISFYIEFDGVITFDVDGTFIINTNGHTLSAIGASPITISVTRKTTIILRGGGSFETNGGGASITNHSSDSEIIIENAKIMKGLLYSIHLPGGTKATLRPTNKGSAFLVNGKEYTNEYTIKESVAKSCVVIPIESRGGVNIKHHVEGSYDFTIPLSVNLGETVEVSVQNVKLKKGREIVLRLIGTSDSENEFKLKTTRGAEITYEIKDEENNKLFVGDSVIKASGGQNIVKKLKFEQPTNVTNSGHYTGTVNFTVSIE